MAVCDILMIGVALPLAVAAAVLSSGAETRQEIASFVAQALTPQAVDFGTDPETATEAASPVQPRETPAAIATSTTGAARSM